MSSSLDHRSLEWNTERALKIMAARGIEGYLIDIDDGQYASSQTAGFGMFWFQFLEKDDAELFERDLMERSILGEVSLSDFCVKVALAWAHRTGKDGRYAFDPTEGLSRIEVDQVDEDGDSIVTDLLPFKGARQSSPVLAEWSTPDWSHWSLVDVSDFMKGWISESGAFLDNIQDDFTSGNLEDDMDLLIEYDDDEIRRYDTFVEEKYAESDDYESEYESMIINPHMVFPSLLTGNRKFLTWADYFVSHAETSSMCFAEKLVRAFARQLPAVSAPSMTRQQKRALERKRAKMH